ncbi:hypothetical protein DLJ53_26750 [Acuticoccus sediminis]|uniref:Uncharacterized protein n=1 Tax=Acuticoccus sediminis TaxID=2184697 RepID=A0A8B2NNQ9_9HYPH|nr:hypothetical protein [Acuticoccus sediminis]RAH98309.1 hypothetical protein DLJ53_26750 [Acuticoccus sediminis]
MSVKRQTDPVEVMVSADYLLPAELFVARRLGSNRSGIGYHRFATAAEAIEFAVEKYSSLRPDDLVMTIDDKRFNLGAIKALHKNLGHRTAAA